MPDDLTPWLLTTAEAVEAYNDGDFGHAHEGRDTFGEAVDRVSKAQAAKLARWLLPPFQLIGPRARARLFKLAAWAAKQEEA